MKINKSQLLEALEIVKPGLANKEIIEQATSFAFMKDRVVTYNDEISISHPIEGLDLYGAIQAEALYKFLGKIKKDELDLELKDNQIILTTGRAKAGLAIQAEITLPLESEISEKGKWKKLPENFNKFMFMAMNACSKDMSKPLLTCVNVRKDGIIEGCDNYRIINCDFGMEMLVDTFLIPASSVADVVKLQPTKIANGKGWMHFLNAQDTIISCRIIEEVYPSTSHLLNIKGIRLILPNTTNEVLDRAMVFSKRDRALDEMVDVSIADRRFKMTAKNDSSWFEEDVNMKYDGEPIQFSITPHLLKSILLETKECLISDNNSVLKFEGEGWQYMSMLRNI